MSTSHASTKPNHPYHLVDPSPWPVVGAISAGIMAVGGVLFMHKVTPWVLPIGFLMVLATMFFWFRDVVREVTYEGHHSAVVQIGLRYGMLLFIASEVMFFSAFFWAYFDSSLFPKEATGGVWPPKGILPFDPFSLPLLNTLILLTSGTTVTWAHHALLENDRQGLKWGLILTILLGATFTCVQAYEYSHALFNFSGNIYGATFFMATGFHGFHVLVGTIFLIVCLLRANAGHFTPTQHLGFEFAAWYWHFVDVVWLFLFICIYVWGTGGGRLVGAE
jgi:cytochrome c oxidase subunit III